MSLAAAAALATEAEQLCLAEDLSLKQDAAATAERLAAELIMDNVTRTSGVGLFELKEGEKFSHVIDPARNGDCFPMAYLKNKDPTLEGDLLQAESDLLRKKMGVVYHKKAMSEVDISDSDAVKKIDDTRHAISTRGIVMPEEGIPALAEIDAVDIQVLGCDKYDR